MSRTLTTIAFDADDTLWHNERFFRIAEAAFCDLLAQHTSSETVEQTLLDHERKNIALYGFGVKGFTLSMIETACALAPAADAGRIIPKILDLGRDMLAHPVEVLPGVPDVLESLSGRFDLMVVTKGDLFDQERKLAHSGLADFFGHVEIVSDKTPDIYSRVFDRHGQGARRAMMIGNSLKSDVIPALAAGAWGVHVPHEQTWALEHADAPEHHERFRIVNSIGEIRALVDQISETGTATGGNP